MTSGIGTGTEEHGEGAPRAGRTSIHRKVIMLHGFRRTACIAAIASLTIVPGACTDAEPFATDALEPDPARVAGPEIAPAGLVGVVVGGAELDVWPYTGTDVAGAASDPINLVFPGRDMREVRAALMALNGDRTAFGMPAAPPFDCTWKDAIGANQTSYTAEHGWQGSAIQLECGDYQPMRFHIRLFDAGAAVLGNAHFEVIIPGTNRHEVLSWELAEQVIRVDFLRSGLLEPAAPIGSTGIINPAPTFKTINPLVYNGLPPALRGLIGGPLGNVTGPVPIPSDGRATVINLMGAPAIERYDRRNQWVLRFNQVIPRPFCSAGPADYLYVQGPIDFDQHVSVNGSGRYSSVFKAEGTLTAVPVNPLTGQPTGAPFTAYVRARYTGRADDQDSGASNTDLQEMIAEDGSLIGRFWSRLDASDRGPDHAVTSVRCS